MDQTPGEPLDAQTAIAIARQAADDALQAVAAADAGTALVPTGADAAMAVKSQMALTRAGLAHARKNALAAQESARDAIRRQQADLDAQIRAMNAELAPLEERLGQLKEGIWTMNLYLGRDEQIHTLAEGEPAAAGTPVYVRQQVLAMDEECALSAEDGGIDVRNVEQFDAWITASPEHLNQLLPEERGVVAVIARRAERDYGDPWSNVALNEKNHQTWWLIRNGENLYRMQTDFTVGGRLVPARNEFTSMFVDPWTKEPLEPGTDAWMKAEKAAGARERHFMRVALVLQGLIDRTAVFSPLPIAGLSLLTPQHYDDGHVVLIADDENQIGTGRQPFYSWLRSKNSNLTTGMRIAFTSRHQGWPRRSTEHGSYDHHERLNPRTAETPPTGVHVLERRGESPGEFVFLYERTREEWMGSGYNAELRVPKTRASATVRVDDKFIVPVDLVTIEEMRAYLGARTERSAYADMFPVLKAVIALKEAEALAEAPFRDLLAAQVAQAEDIDLDAAHTAIDPVIATWKVGARWFRPMSGDATVEARAAKEILAERARIVRANAGAGDDDAFIARAKREHPGALLVARKKDGSYVVLTPSPRAWTTTKDGKTVSPVPLDVWVDRHEYTRGGKARPVVTWQLVQPAVVSRWITLHESPTWATWTKTARVSDHLSDPEIRNVIARIVDLPVEGLDLMAIDYREEAGWYNDGRLFTAWYHPGPVTVTDRPLTQRVPNLSALTRGLRASRERDGSISVRWTSSAPCADNTTAWSPPFNHLIRPTHTASPSVPWDGNHEQRMVHLDDDAFARARVDADAWESARQTTAQLAQVAETVMSGAHADWQAGKLAAAKGRFLEDYADETLWEDHAKTIKLGDYPLGRHRETDVASAVWHAVHRLVEDGTPPWGLTIGEALELLGEAPTALTGPFWEKTRTPIEVPAEVLALRLADEPKAGTLQTSTVS